MCPEVCSSAPTRSPCCPDTLPVCREEIPVCQLTISTVWHIYRYLYYMYSMSRYVSGCSETSVAAPVAVLSERRVVDATTASVVSASRGGILIYIQLHTDNRICNSEYHSRGLHWNSCTSGV
eukprot:COSAG02_NODE_16043_length_1118_cov_1.244357_1_plen_122_part_00